MISMEEEQQAVGTNSTTSSQLQFDNNGIYVNYPVSWKMMENTSKYNIATFLAPSINSSDTPPAAIGIHRQNLSLSFIPPIASPNPTVPSSLVPDDEPFFGEQLVINETMSDQSVAKNNLSIKPIEIDEEDLFVFYSHAIMKYIYENFDIINIKPTNLSGSAAYQIDFTTDENVISYIWTMTNYDVYGISLVANSSTYIQYRPELERMQHSFEIVTS